MSGYSIGFGFPPLNCNICGARVPRELCERHPREIGFIALRDKFLGMLIIRMPSPQTSAPQAGPKEGSRE